MNAAMMIGDNTRAAGPAQTGSRATTASESTTDEPQQRFAEVLPLAQAAVEQASNRDETDKAPATGRSSKGQTGSEASDGASRPAHRQEDDATSDVQAAAWTFAGAVQPLVQAQASSSSRTAQVVKTVAGQQTVESTAAQKGQKGFDPAKAAQVVAGVGAGSVRPQQQTQNAQQPQPQPQLSGTERSAIASVTTTTSLNAAGSGTQQVASQALAAAKQGSGATQQTPDVAATAPNAQTAVAGTRVAKPDARTEATKTTASEAIGSTKGNVKTDPSADKAAPAVHSSVAQEKAGQTSAKPQSPNSQQAAGTETAPKPGQTASDSSPVAESHADRVTKSAAAVRHEVAKGESPQRESKDATAHVAKEAGFVVPDSQATAGGESGVATQTVASATRGQTSVDVPAVRSPVQSVGEQILDSIRSSGSPGEREVFVRLNPPELGTVVVRFQERGENLVGTLEVSTKEAQREIEQALPQVVRGLQEAGVLVRRVEVVTSDQPDRNLGGEHTPQDVWQQHQGPGQGREHSPASQTRWAQGLGEHRAARQANAGEESQTAGASGRIDVLL